jgi:hypothetical protein
MSLCPGLVDDFSSGCRVCQEPCRPDSRYCSGACAQLERDCYWSLVKDKLSQGTPAYRWAREQLGLVDRDEHVTRGRPGGHVCGWTETDTGWRCAQDHYAAGYAPETACGETWP